jgi:ketosteroid isomerase-like protein
MLVQAHAPIRAAYHHWNAGDLEGLAAGLAPSARYTVHLDHPAWPAAGVHQGAQAIAAAVARLRQTFDIVVLRPGQVLPLGDHSEGARCRVEFYVRDRTSGQVLASRLWHRWRLEGGLITSCDEYHDAGLVGAFLEMAGAPLLQPA